MLGRGPEAQTGRETKRRLESNLTPALLLLTGLIIGLTACTTPQSVIQAKATATATPPIPPVIEVSPGPTPYYPRTLYDVYRSHIYDLSRIPMSTDLGQYPSWVGESFWDPNIEVTKDTSPDAGGRSLFNYVWSGNDITGCKIVKIVLPVSTESNGIPPEYADLTEKKEISAEIVACDIAFKIYDLDKTMYPQDELQMLAFLDALAAIAATEPGGPYGFSLEGNSEWDAILSTYRVEPTCVTSSLKELAQILCKNGNTIPTNLPLNPNEPLPKDFFPKCDFSEVPEC